MTSTAAATNSSSQVSILLRVSGPVSSIVEPVHRRQVLVAVTEMVLAELPRRVAVVLEQLRNRGILCLQPDRRVREPHFAQTGAEHALAGDERRSSCRAALLSVRVGEADPLVGDAVDVGCAVPHQPVAVATEVRDADVVAPDYEDVRLALRH